MTINTGSKIFGYVKYSSIIQVEKLGLDCEKLDTFKDDVSGEFDYSFELSNYKRAKELFAKIQTEYERKLDLLVPY